MSINQSVVMSHGWEIKRMYGSFQLQIIRVHK